MTKGGTYLALGDSITWKNYATGATGNDLYATKLATAIQTNYGNIKHINKGIGGSTSTSFLAQSFWWNRIKADIVTIGLGMNDSANAGVSTSTYSANLTSIIALIRKHNPKVAIILCSPSTTNDANRTPYIAGYRTAMATVATNTGCAYCDFSSAWTTSTGDMNTYVFTDGIHPNQAGHTALYNLLYPIVQTAAATFLTSLGA